MEILVKNVKKTALPHLKKSHKNTIKNELMVVERQLSGRFNRSESLEWFIKHFSAEKKQYSQI